jgi:predicted component of type VI protein secretion system
MKIPRDCDRAALAKALRRLACAVVRQDGSRLRLTTQRNRVHHVTVPNHRLLNVGCLQVR